jgi:hypothetical protein
MSVRSLMTQAQGVPPFCQMTIECISDRSQRAKTFFRVALDSITPSSRISCDCQKGSARRSETEPAADATNNLRL